MIYGRYVNALAKAINYSVESEQKLCGWKERDN